MQLNTQRLTLREISLTDLANVHELHSLPETNEFNALGIPVSVDVTNELISQWLLAAGEPARIKYVFVVSSGDKFVGLFGINIGKPAYKNAEIWYKLHPRQWNNGYATEAANAVLKYCFEELKLHRVEAGCAVGNIASIKVLEKIGMIKEGRTRQLLPIRGQWLDTFIFAILESDFSENLSGKG